MTRFSARILVVGKYWVTSFFLARILVVGRYWVTLVFQQEFWLWGGSGWLEFFSKNTGWGKVLCDFSFSARILIGGKVLSDFSFSAGIPECVQFLNHISLWLKCFWCVLSGSPFPLSMFASAFSCAGNWSRVILCIGLCACLCGVSVFVSTVTEWAAVLNSTATVWHTSSPSFCCSGI